jgi:peroxiredoxin
MSALAVGATAPDFKLKTVEGNTLSLAALLDRGPVVLVFFKVSCPTCQYSLPFYERLFQTYKNRQVTLIGISQNNAEETTAFAREFGITFALLIDEVPTYPVSSAYGLTNVPSTFWIETDGKIVVNSVGWSKADFEKINQDMAERSAMAAPLLFRPHEDVREYRAG